ncbi:ABC transporter G family member 9-like [Lytechinus variegatus]|uniref:ABC transporter G family member 9-like n=1 Tax=Lytechinus variegatus TaxID=7654 RepID=UPI001BB0EB7F|nr:ABC transporter G family member 9-like [Lytechinus variegatus]
MDYDEKDDSTLEFRNVCLTLKDKDVLKNVSGSAEPGKLLALMGPSGAGKTMLLTALAGRYQGTQKGQILLGQKPLDKTLRRKISFVLQEDVFFDQLTLRDTLMYTAQLRLPEKMPIEEKRNRVKNIVKSLGLRKCLNTKMGNSLSRGLSGGEKKRANIGCELLTDPAVLLLDEPTSGLDSHGASELIMMLKKYARRYGKTVVACIHQPSSHTFRTFDNLLLLSDGEVMYFGQAGRVTDYFAHLGLHCSQHYNPADFVTLSVDEIQPGPSPRRSILMALPGLGSRYKQSSGTGAVRQPRGVRASFAQSGYAMQQPMVSRMSIAGLHDLEQIREHFKEDNNNKWPTSFWHQVCTLSNRNFKQYRTIILSRLELARHLLLGCFIGAFYFRVDHIEERIRDITGMMFFIIVYWSFESIFGAISAFPQERAIINKERSAGAYRLSSYFFSKILSELPLKLALPFCSSTIAYWLAGLNASPGVFVGFVITILLNNQVAHAIGLFIGASTNSFQAAIAGGSLYMLSSLLLGGFYVSTFPSYIEWFRFTSVISYTYGATLHVIFALQPQPVRCSTTAVSLFRECLPPHDPAASNVRGYSIVLKEASVVFPIWAYYLILLAIMAVFYLLAYLVLRFVRKPS